MPAATSPEIIGEAPPPATVTTLTETMTGYPPDSTLPPTSTVTTTVVTTTVATSAPAKAPGAATATTPATQTAAVPSAAPPPAASAPPPALVQQTPPAAQPASTTTATERKPVSSGAELPKNHTVDHGGVLHAPGSDAAVKRCGACHGTDLRGGKKAKSSCYDCHDQNWK